MTFDEAFDRLIGHEGGYVNHPSDPGGATNWGITQRVAMQDGYTGDMRNFPRDRAKSIYRRLYWAPVMADLLPENLRFDVFDAAVNSGVGQAVKWLQTVVGAEPDGQLGPKTLIAIGQADSMVAARYLGVRLQFMTNLPTWGSFGKGWARRIAGNLMNLKD